MAFKYIIKFINTKGFTIRSSSTFWGHVTMGPADPILGITEAYRKDKNPKKVNVGVGAYRDDDGKPWILPCVQQAEQRVIAKKLNKEYLPISGDAEFCKLAVQLLLEEDHPRLKAGANATVQSLSGTGALRFAGAFFREFAPVKLIYVPTPTWPTHFGVFRHSGLEVKTYAYYDEKNIAFNKRKCISDISRMPNKSIVLFHACAHNPTGIDPNPTEWREIAETVQKRRLYTLFDFAYQGFASGDPDKDAFAPRLFIQKGLEVCICQSFAKNMGLYGERVGTMSLISNSGQKTPEIMSRLKILIRPMISNPPLHGARIVKEILGSEDLKAQWLKDVKTMADRIINIRAQLQGNLKKLGSSKNWQHITDQIGMFCYTGLNKKQVARLTNEFHIYLTKDGRISMAGVTSKNVDYLADAIHKVTK